MFTVWAALVAFLWLDDFDLVRSDIEQEKSWETLEEEIGHYMREINGDINFVALAQNI